jgi:hypothetical protein
MEQQLKSHNYTFQPLRPPPPQIKKHCKVFFRTNTYFGLSMGVSISLCDSLRILRVDLLTSVLVPPLSSSRRLPPRPVPPLSSSLRLPRPVPPLSSSRRLARPVPPLSSATFRPARSSSCPPSSLTRRACRFRRSLP